MSDSYFVMNHNDDANTTTNTFKHLKVNDATIKGSHCKVWGDRNLVLGTFVEVYGNYNTCNGAYAEVYGDHNTCRGAFSKTFGKHNTCIGSFCKIKREIPSGMPPPYTAGTPPLMVTQTFTNTNGEGKLTQTFINCDSVASVRGLMAVGNPGQWGHPVRKRAISLPKGCTVKLIGRHGLCWGPDSSGLRGGGSVDHLGPGSTIDEVPWPDYRKAFVASMGIVEEDDDDDEDHVHSCFTNGEMMGDFSKFIKLPVVIAGNRIYCGYIEANVNIPKNATVHFCGDTGLAWYTDSAEDSAFMAHLRPGATINGTPWREYYKLFGRPTEEEGPVASLKDVKAEALSDDDEKEEKDEEEVQQNQGTKRKRKRTRSASAKKNKATVKKRKVSAAATGGAGQCSICMVNKSTVAFIPCGHVCSCPTCAKTLAANAKKQRKPMTCPICTKKVKRAQRIFMST